MSRIRHALRLLAQGRSKRLIAEQTGTSRTTLHRYFEAFTASGLSFPEIDKLSDKDLEDLPIKPPEAPGNDRVATLIGLFPGIEKALKRKGATRQELWKQYAAATPDALKLSQFNTYYRQWKASANPTMRIDPPVSKRCKGTDEKTIAYAMLDRIVHDVQRLELQGESLRRKKPTASQGE